jgi:S-adenosylmethionine/arginine decarboxylase-like enzyme
MFATKKYAGKHLICDFQDIPSFDLDLKALCKELCALHQLTILQEVEHVFQPQGYTLLFLLSESHLSLHTFPEKKYISFDLYTCREYPDNTVYLAIYEWLCTKMSAKGTYHILDRTF